MTENIKIPFVDLYPQNEELQDEIDLAIKDIIRKSKKIDILVNNAATKTKNLRNFFNLFQNYRLSDWKEIILSLVRKSALNNMRHYTLPSSLHH